MCKCGCNTCETKGPLLTEGKVKSLLSEGLQYHIDKKIPLFETVYRIGSNKHLSLIKEARKMYSRNIIDLCEEDEHLIKTHLGEFGIYEGESVPLDLPMLEAEIDYEKEKTWRIQDKFPIEVTVKKGWTGNYYTIKPKPMDISYDAFIDLGSGGNVGYRSYNYITGEAQWISDSLEQIKQWEEDNQDKIKVIYPNNLNESNIPSQEEVNKFFSDTQQEIHYLNSKPVKDWDEYDMSNWKSKLRKKELGRPQFGESLKEQMDIFDDIANEEFGMDYDQLGPGEKEWVRDEINNMSMNEVLQEKLKGIDGKACWKGYKLAGTKKKGGKTVDNCVPMEEAKQDIYDKFLDNPSSPKGRAKSLILKFTKEYGDGASSMAVDRFASKNNLKPEEKYILKYITKNDIKISSQSGGPDFSAVSEAEFKGKEVALNKPKRGGPKAYYVYVKDGDKVKKVTFGSGGLRAKIKNKDARNAFAARHNCKDKKDRTTPGYWSCNLPRYAQALGLGANMNTFW
jgi:hypothetical protein